MNRITPFILLILSLPAIAQAQNSAPEPIVIKNVNIIPMTINNKVIENATVVIEGNKIVSINKPAPASAEVINGKGKWLIPGLIDKATITQMLSDLEKRNAIRTEKDDWGKRKEY